MLRWLEFGASDENKAVSLLDVAEGHFSAYLAIDISPSVLGPIPHARMQVRSSPNQGGHIASRLLATLGDAADLP